MDKLRALHYFVAAAEHRSFSGAARHHDVSVPAVVKLIAALERDLGIRLFDRSTQGLTLTAAGEAYLDDCRAILERLAVADEAASASSRKAAGTVVVRAPHLLSRLVLVPALQRLHATHPAVQVELRPLERLQVTNADGAGIDLLFALGLAEAVDLVQRPLARTRLLVCASAAYWQRHGRPTQPEALAAHQCLQVRSPEGTVIDYWHYRRGSEERKVAVRGFLVSESRDLVLEAVLQGQGISRFADLSIWPHLHSGSLEPVLLDWSPTDSPELSVLYRSQALRTPRTRAVLDAFVAAVHEVEAACRMRYAAVPQVRSPQWYSARPGRVSAGRARE